MTHTRTAHRREHRRTAPAMALQEADIESLVYKAHPGSAQGIGAFLTLATNGVDALGTLGAGQAGDRASAN